METILVLEDMETVRRVLTAMLRKSGYDVLEAETGEQALKVQRTYERPIHLLVADVSLPGRCSGTQVALELLPVLPDLKVLFISGAPVDVWPMPDFQNIQRLPAGSCSLLVKPFTREALAQKVRQLLTGTQTRTVS